MISREEWLERKRQFEAFNRWEEQQAPEEVDPAQLVADIGAIRDWLPFEVQIEDPDPEKLGLRRLLNALTVLDARR